MEREDIEPEKIVFPCEYPIKVVAQAREGLRQHLDQLFSQHFGEFEPHRVAVRQSSQAAFVAHTYTMVVQHVDQLGALHTDLKLVEGVVMVL